MWRCMLFKCSLCIKAWNSSAAPLPYVCAFVSVDHWDFCCCCCFSLSTNPLYPNCAVLNISRHTGKVTLLSWSKRAKYSILSVIMVSCIKCYHQCLLRSLFRRVEMYVHRHSLPSVVLERAFQCRLAVLWAQRMVCWEGGLQSTCQQGLAIPQLFPNPLSPAASDLAFC